MFAPSRVEQWVMQSFFERGHWYRHIRKARSLYRKRHQHLVALIQDQLGDHVEITGQNAGLHWNPFVKKGVVHGLKPCSQRRIEGRKPFF